MARYIIICILAVCLFSVPEPEAASEELEIVNRPVGITGLTGLLSTISPYTLPSGTVEVGASILSENSDIPDFTITEYPLSVTVGIDRNAEIAVRSSWYNIKEGPTTTATPVDRFTGNVELAYKWNFLTQSEGSWYPAAALFVIGMIPTEPNKSSQIDTVARWSLRLGLSAGSEISWKDYVLAIYADASLTGQDLTEQRIKDTYGMLDAGLVFPISKYKNLQMLMEYSLVSGRDGTTLSGRDYTALTYGLRLVSERFNLTVGSQLLHKELEGFKEADRLIGLMSLKF